MEVHPHQQKKDFKSFESLNKNKPYKKKPYKKKIFKKKQLK